MRWSKRLHRWNALERGPRKLTNGRMAMVRRPGSQVQGRRRGFGDAEPSRDSEGDSSRTTSRSMSDDSVQPSYRLDMLVETQQHAVLLQEGA